MYWKTWIFKNDVNKFKMRKDKNLTNSSYKKIETLFANKSTSVSCVLREIFQIYKKPGILILLIVQSIEKKALIFFTARITNMNTKT